VSDDLSELEAKVAATFEADQWSMEGTVPAEIEDGSAENGAVREVQMNVTPSCICGNRPSAT
jgi:hypothetical protein